MSGAGHIEPFIARMKAAAADLSEPSRYLVIAHAAFESGWGRAIASRLGCNHWNLTRTAKDSRPIVKGYDKEPDGKGGWKPITQRFRAYGSDREALLDYLDFLARPRYARALAALRAGNTTLFVRFLHDDDPRTREIEGGFFTADRASYEAGLASCLALVRHLEKPPAKVA